MAAPQQSQSPHQQDQEQQTRLLRARLADLETQIQALAAERENAHALLIALDVYVDQHTEPDANPRLVWVEQLAGARGPWFDRVQRLDQCLAQCRDLRRELARHSLTS
jgi:hypothetical protein